MPTHNATAIGELLEQPSVTPLNPRPGHAELLQELVTGQRAIGPSVGRSRRGTGDRKRIRARLDRPRLQPVSESALDRSADGVIYFTSSDADSEYVAPVFRSLTVTVTV
jgi:hypothetical protein